MLSSGLLEWVFSRKLLKFLYSISLKMFLTYKKSNMGSKWWPTNDEYTEILMVFCCLFSHCSVTRRNENCQLLEFLRRNILKVTGFWKSAVHTWLMKYFQGQSDGEKKVDPTLSVPPWMISHSPTF